jgi:hypothetical protein
MSFIQDQFKAFLSSYDATKLGFIVSQSNVETYVRTEFAWFLEENLNNERRYEIYIELNRIDLQVYDSLAGVTYFIEFGHHVNLHKLDVGKSFDNKRESDRAKLPQKNKFDGQVIEFVHINLLTHFDLANNPFVHIEESAATYKKYGNRNKSFNFLSAESNYKFDFSWKNSKGHLFVQIA